MLHDAILGTETAKYRTFWPRLCAGFIDGLALLPLYVLVAWVSRHASPPVVLLLYIAGSVLTIAYSVVLHGLFGQTLGKMLLRVRVLDVSERPLSMRQAILRDSPSIILSCLQVFGSARFILSGGDPFPIGRQLPNPAWLNHVSLLWFVVEVLTMLTNAKRRALHDWIAGSVVVRV